MSKLEFKNVKYFNCVQNLKKILPIPDRFFGMSSGSMRYRFMIPQPEVGQMKLGIYTT